MDAVGVTLATLEEMALLADAAQTEILLLVAEAYLRGSSWNDVARRLGRSKQSAHQRYQARVHARQTRQILADDLTTAEQVATQTHLHGGDHAQVAESNRFLRAIQTR